MIDCFKNNGRQDLQDLQDSYVAQGMKDHEAARRVIIEEYNRITSEINTFRTQQSLPEIKFDPIKEGIDVTSIEEKYNKEIEQKKEELKKQENDRKSKAAGNRLFNEPIKEVTNIADRYFKRVFGRERPKFTGTRELNLDFAKKIAKAYEDMKNDPENLEVLKSYNALINETLAQYDEMLKNGYSIEINNSEPYNNSQEMINDLKENKRLKIFSTESGFGTKGITDDIRSKNPMLKDSGLRDINGIILLNNDIFRAVHDFFGHAELGNSFGEKGEENAYQVHARMFSPLARRALATETRGQNSFVNFSGINEKIENLRKEARRLRKEGKNEEAQKIVNQIFESFSFSDQKIGLLPEEYSNIDEKFEGDLSEGNVTKNPLDQKIEEKVNEFSQVNHEDTSKIREILDMDALKSQQIGVDDSIQEAQKYITKDPNSEGGWSKEMPLIQMALAGVPLDAPQQIAIGNAISKMLKERELLYLQIEKADELGGKDTPPLLHTLFRLEDTLSTFIEALDKAGSTTGRALAIRKEYLNFDKMDPAVYLASFKNAIEKMGGELTDKDRKTIDELAGKYVRDRKQATKDLLELGDKTAARKRAVADIRMKDISNPSLLSKVHSRSKNLNEALLKLDKAFSGKVC